MTLDWKRTTRASAIIGLALLLSACASVPSVPRGDLPVLIDPRLGFDGPTSKAVEKKFEAAWQKLAAGEIDKAEKAFVSIATKDPKYAPATLGRAVVALAKDQSDIAERHVVAISYLE